MLPLSAPAQRRALAALVLATLPAATTGCYSYATVAPGDGRGGEEVMIEVSDQGTTDLVPTLGPRVQSIDGRLGGYTDTSLTVYATRVTRFGGSEQSLAGDTVVLHRRSVGRVSSRQFSLTRTLLLAGGGLVAAIALGSMLNGGENVAKGPGGGPSGGQQ